MKISGIKCKYTLTALNCDNNTVKLVATYSRMKKNCVIFFNGRFFRDTFNDCEPYDRKTGVFYVPTSILTDNTSIRLETTDLLFPAKRSRIRLSASDIHYTDEEFEMNNCDNRLSDKKLIEKETPCTGCDYTHELYTTKLGKPVHVFTLVCDTDKTKLYIGTPDDGLKSRKVKATIPEMIASAENNGKKVIASINGDFFDMFGDMHPSGLTVKKGRVIANPASKRPFIGVTKDGKAVITDITENPDIIENLDCAAAGLQRIVKNGEVYDFAIGESFGYTPHPRSAVGITADGKVVLTVVDGRIPDYSNGASLYDLALLMLERGCTQAINIDGGGSSAVYIKHNGNTDLMSVPADLKRPNDKLIRKEANCIMVTENG